MSEDVLIAVDPHKASNTAAVLDPVSKTVIEAARMVLTAMAPCRGSRGPVLAVRWHRAGRTLHRGYLALPG
jgi:hypothetical protein